MQINREYAFVFSSKNSAKRFIEDISKENPSYSSALNCYALTMLSDSEFSNPANVIIGRFVGGGFYITIDHISYKHIMEQNGIVFIDSDIAIQQGVNGAIMHKALEVLGIE